MFLKHFYNNLGASEPKKFGLDKWILFLKGVHHCRAVSDVGRAVGRPESSPPLALAIIASRSCANTPVAKTSQEKIAIKLRSLVQDIIVFASHSESLENVARNALPLPLRRRPCLPAFRRLRLSSDRSLPDSYDKKSRRLFHRRQKDR